MHQDHPVWSPVYNDFTSGKLTITVAKAVRDAHNDIVGVAAADVELYSLTAKLTSLAISRNGIAYLMDQEGRILAASDWPQSMAEQTGEARLQHAREIMHPLIQASHEAVLGWKNRAHPDDPP